MPLLTKPAPKSKHRRLIAVMLGIVLVGGVVNLVMMAGKGGSGEGKEEYQIVDVTIPPPPPPPPSEEEELEEPEEMEELDEVEQSVAPTEMAAESEESPDLDLGIDIGELAASAGSGFVMDIPRFGRGSSGGGDAEDMLGGDMDSSPAPMSKTPPVYPSSLLKNGVGGKVLVSCTIDADGKVIATSIKSSSGHPDLDKAAINAVNRWKFKPGMRGGKKVKSVALVPFNFEVKKS